MILTDENGNRVDYFHKFPKEEKNIGLMLSGGADSALILYCFMRRFLSEGINDVKIYPIHGYDVARKYAKSWVAAENVIAEIKKKFNHIESNIIQPLHVFAYLKETHDKRAFHAPNCLYMKDRHNINFIVHGWSKPPPYQSRVGLIENEMNPLQCPWIDVDKKFIAYQYKKFKLDDLYRATVSCTGDDPNGVPCKSCWWCKEKYWAFGSYDGGIQ